MIHSRQDVLGHSDRNIFLKTWGRFSSAYYQESNRNLVSAEKTYQDMRWKELIGHDVSWEFALAMAFFAYRIIVISTTRFSMVYGRPFHVDMSKVIYAQKHQRRHENLISTMKLKTLLKQPLFAKLFYINNVLHLCELLYASQDYISVRMIFLR